MEAKELEKEVPILPYSNPIRIVGCQHAGVASSLPLPPFETILFQACSLLIARWRSPKQKQPLALDKVPRPQAVEVDSAR
jgi:hypothetical protein